MRRCFLSPIAMSPQSPHRILSPPQEEAVMANVKTVNPQITDLITPETTAEKDADVVRPLVEDDHEPPESSAEPSER
jgi:hypothetical protein